MSTLAVGMWQLLRAFNMPTASVGMAPEPKIPAAPPKRTMDRAGGTRYTISSCLLLLRAIRRP